jgi:DMSO/TMAO reductase YedYZ molybdopterin-dependent catalytic subunit
MTTKNQTVTKTSIWTTFFRGTFAGLVALGFLFLLRLGGIAPYPPESALEALLRIIPESIQEPSVQALGELAGQLGLLISTLVAVVVYGLFGILFEKVYAPRMLSRNVTRFEKFLIFALFPWLFFGLIVLPISQVSVFGIASGFGSASSNFWVFPLGLLLGNLIYGVVLSWEYKDTKVFAKVNPLAKSVASPKVITEPKGVSRRSFVEKGAIALASLALMVASIDSLLTLTSTGPPQASSGSAVNLGNAPPIFQDPRLASLVDSEITANDDFYRVGIDIEVLDPMVNVSSYSLQVAGLVGNPKTYSLSDLQALPKTMEYNTFECVSNVVNGNLISNAEWGGVKLSDLFSDVGGLQSSAQYVVFYSIDGYSVGIPVSRAMMKDAMLAYEMNGVPLPQHHGYPLRAVVPGLYGMMSAKWVRKIQVIDQTYMGYWQTRGWSNVGDVETLAFIILPGNSQSLSQNNGSVLLGGYAYGGDRGISKVEVSTDGGKTWELATLKPSLSNLTWTLWAYDWHPTSTGTFPVYARATDSTGAVQTSQITDTFPNGATGYAMISVDVTN